MSALSAAASDEDGDIIKALRDENDRLLTEVQRLTLYATGADMLMNIWKERAQEFMESRDELLDVLKLAISSHGVMLLSDPPLDAWKTFCVEARARAAIAKTEGEA